MARKTCIGMEEELEYLKWKETMTYVRYKKLSSP